MPEEESAIHQPLSAQIYVYLTGGWRATQLEFQGLTGLSPGLRKKLDGISVFVRHKSQHLQDSATPTSLTHCPSIRYHQQPAHSIMASFSLFFFSFAECSATITLPLKRQLFFPSVVGGEGGPRDPAQVSRGRGSGTSLVLLVDYPT